MRIYMSVFARVRRCSSHKVWWGWSWRFEILKRKKENDDEEEEERTLSLGSERILRETWRGRVGLMKMWMCVCVSGCIAMSFTKGGGWDIFHFVIIKETNWIIKVITLDNPCTCLTQKACVPHTFSLWWCHTCFIV